MSGQANLETLLERRANKKRVGAEDLWHRYRTVKQYLADEYYPWVQSACPYYTDHGERHVQSVIEAASMLLLRQLDSGRTGEFSTLDVFLTLSSIIWHDVAMVFGRAGHAEEENISKISQGVQETAFPDPTMLRHVTEIVRAHTEDRLHVPADRADCTLGSQTLTIFPRSLAALVRLADEVSDNRSRISEDMLEHVPENARIYWEYARCVTAAKPEPNLNRVTVTVDLHADVVPVRLPCPEHAEDDGCIAFMHYVLRRLEKMNSERAYCRAALSKYAQIDEIVANLSVYDGVHKLDGYQTTLTLGDSGMQVDQRRDIPIFAEFFETHPNWEPEKIAEAVGH